MQPKIQTIRITVTATQKGLTNAAAYDGTGQFRGDLTTDNQIEVMPFIEGLNEHAENVNIESVTVYFAARN